MSISVLLSVFVAIQEFGLWEDLQPGPFEVGYEVREEYDPSRHDPRSDDDGRLRPRQIQVSMWYPALPSEATPLRFRDYLSVAVAQQDFSKRGDEEEEQRAHENFRSRVRRLGLADEEAIEAILDRVCLARDEPEHATGRFPLLIYAPSFSSSPFENHILVEYLASHGFIVASCPSRGPERESMSANYVGMRTQARDLAFVLGTLREHHAVNDARVGAFGFSWGGWSSVLLATENAMVRCVASLDGTPGLGWPEVRHGMKARAPYHDPRNLRTPYLEIQGSGKGNTGSPRLDNSLYSHQSHGDSWLLHLRRLSHPQFASTSHIAARTPQTSPESSKSYEILCRYVLAFFEAQLEESETSRTLLTQEPSQSGFPSPWVGLLSRPALAKPWIVGEDLLDSLRGPEGISVLSTIEEVLAQTPDRSPFEYRPTVELGREWLEAGRASDAVALLELLTAIFPDRFRGIWVLAQALEADGRPHEALEAFDHVEALNPGIPDVGRAVNRLRDN